MQKIDKKDKKILFQLCENAKQPLSKIAKKVQLSKNSVSYRIEKLKEKGIIQGFTTELNIQKLGYTTYLILIKLRSNPQEQKEVANFLSNYEFTYWLAELSGNWDMLLEIATKSTEHFSKIEETILKEIGEHIEQYEIHTVLRIHKLVPIAEDFFDGKHLTLPKRKNLPHKIDQIDKKILQHLSKVGLATNTEISKIVKLTPEAIAYRVKKLLHSNTIMNFSPIIEPTIVGYSEYLIILTLRNPSKQIDKLRTYIINQRNIQYAFQGATRYEMIILSIFKNIKDLDNMLSDIKNKFFNIIDDYTFLLIKRHLRFTHFPPGIMKD